MTLDDVLFHLTNGELQQLSVGTIDPTNPDPAKYDLLISHVNLGLSALYRRFFLKEGRIQLELQEGIHTYRLTSEYAMSRRGGQGARYLMDTRDEPFEDDLIKVEGVYSDKGAEFSLNYRDNPLSIMTPSATTLRVPPAVVSQSRDLPESFKTSTLTVVYRATHPKIERSVGFFDPSRVDLELPDTHMDALLYYIASRAHNPTGMVNEFHMGNNFASKYEQACQELEFLNLRIDQQSGEGRLARGGWV